MTNWEKKIFDAFESHYYASLPKAGEDRRVLRLRSSTFFPDFDSASSDEKESYLEAAESLERKGVVKLSWEKRNKGERLKTLSCEDFEKLFKEAKRSFPNTEAKVVRETLLEKADALRKLPVLGGTAGEKKIIALIDFFSIHFSPREIGQGIDSQTMEDFVMLLEFMLEPSRMEKITTRALSILLYRNSKRLENLLSLCKPLLSRAGKIITVPDLSFLERSYPETMISGKIFITFNNQNNPFFNKEGNILGFPLETIKQISGIGYWPGKNEKTVLTIENKETFYALASSQKNTKNIPPYNCYLYIGGYSNRAADALIKILAVSNFSFYHAGDLDPDGILILQHIIDIAGRPVIPLRMDAATFDQYSAWGRTLTKPMLRQIRKVRDDTKAIPGLADLLRRIEETGLGVEQEIIDYR